MYLKRRKRKRKKRREEKEQKNERKNPRERENERKEKTESKRKRRRAEGHVLHHECDDVVLACDGTQPPVRGQDGDTPHGWVGDGHRVSVWMGWWDVLAWVFGFCLFLFSLFLLLLQSDSLCMCVCVFRLF